MLFSSIVMKKNLILLLLSYPSLAYTAIISFDLEISSLSPFSLLETVNYTATVPNTSQLGQNFNPSEQSYDYPILALQASAGGLTTTYSPSELESSRFNFFFDGNGFMFASIIAVPIPTLSIQELQVEAPLTLSSSATHFGGFTPPFNLPQLSGTAQDIALFSEGETLDSQLTRISSSTTTLVSPVDSIELLAEVEITDISGVPEPSSAMMLLFTGGLLGYRRRR